MCHPPQPSEPAAPDRLSFRSRPAAVLEIDIEELAYRVSQPRARTDRRPLICVAPLGETLPSYRIRRRIRDELGADGLDRTIVFTDCPHSAEVWSWLEDSGRGPVAYRERVATTGFWLRGSSSRYGYPRRPSPPGDSAYDGDPRAPGLLLPWLVLRQLRRTGPALLRPGGLASRLVEAHPVRYGLAAATRSLAVVIPGQVEPRAGGWRLLQDIIEDPAGPDSVRAVWRSLLGVRVLDRRCGEGEWLLDALEVLGQIYAACLEQMRIWVADTRLLRKKTRADYLRDFRHALFRAGTPAREGPLGFGRDISAVLNLHGITDDPRGGVHVRNRLSARLRCGRGGRAALPGNALNIRVGNPDFGISTARELSRLLARTGEPASLASCLGEEAEVLGRADRFLRREWFERDMPVSSLRAGLHRVQARVRRLTAELNLLRERSAPASPANRATRLPAERPLHPYAEWHDVMSAGGFHYVHGGE